MPYMRRDPHTGLIVGNAGDDEPEAEYLAYDHPDVLAFLEARGQDVSAIREGMAALRQSDPEMGRTLEDLIDVLIKKRILRMNDLPAVVQNRIAYRVKMRRVLAESLDAIEKQSEQEPPAPALADILKKLLQGQQQETKE
jgi:hypothetical protein